MPYHRFAATLLSALACASWAHTAHAEPPQAQIRFSVQTQLPAFTATVAGVPLLLFVDLGGFSPIALTPAALANIAVTFSGKSMRSRDSTGATFERRSFVAPDVVVGGTGVGSLEGTELPPFPSGSPMNAFAGYLGFGFLQRFLLVFDYPEGVLTLYRSGDTEAMARSCGPNRFAIKVANGVVQSSIDTEKGPLVFHWDTGSSESVLRPSAIGLSASASDPALQSFAKFELGGKNLGRTIFSLREFRAPAVDGVLGNDFLESRVLCIDVQQRVGAIK
jgi:hypothetical protein